MAVLTNKTNFKAGDAVTAEIINDTVETAIVAKQKADDAYQFSTTAKAAAEQASGDSAEAKSNAAQALAEANQALEKADSVVAQAASGKFKGECPLEFSFDGTTLTIVEK